jgi:hypothetical protein
VWRSDINPERRAGVDVNQETEKAQEKPVLSAESFQRLLQAAYFLQVDKDRTVLQPMGAGHTNPLTAGAIVQKRTPSLLARQPSPLESRSASPLTSPRDFNKFVVAPRLATEVTGVSIANAITEGKRAGQVVLRGSAGARQSRNYSGRLMPLFGPIVPHVMNIFTSRVMFLRTVEALAIAMIFFAVIGVSIRPPLLTLPSRTSQEMPEQQSSSPFAMPRARLLASSQRPIVTQGSGQAPALGEADIVAEDVVVRYPKHALSLPGQAEKKPAMLAAETVIQYGPDVSVWAGDPTRRNELDRRRH